MVFISLMLLQRPGESIQKNLQQLTTTFNVVLSPYFHPTVAVKQGAAYEGVFVEIKQRKTQQELQSGRAFGGLGGTVGC